MFPPLTYSASKGVLLLLFLVCFLLAVLAAASTLATADRAVACHLGWSMGGSSALRVRRAFWRDAFIITSKGFDFGFSACWFTCSCPAARPRFLCFDCRIIFPCLPYERFFGHRLVVIRNSVMDLLSWQPANGQNGNLSVGVQTDDDVDNGLKSDRGTRALVPLAVSWYNRLR